MNSKPGSVKQKHHAQAMTSKGFTVDANLAPLLEALWASGVETMFSCECMSRDYRPSDDPLDEHSRTQIVFRRIDQAIDFLKRAHHILSTASPDYRTYDLSLHPATVSEKQPEPGWAIVTIPAWDLDLLTVWW